MEVLPANLWRRVGICLAAASAALFCASCGGEGGGGHGAPAAAPAVAEPKALEVPQAFAEAALQERYAHWYTSYHALYLPMNKGFRLRARLEGDGDLVGIYDGLTNGSLILVTATGVTNIPAEQLSAATRHRVFVNDFADYHARFEVEAERARSASAPEGAAAETNAEPVLEQRFAVTEGSGLDLRSGPGKNFKAAEGVLLQKGELISVLQERGGWIRFNAATTGGTPAAVWINKFATTPIKDVDAAEQENDIKSLQDDGVIVEFVASNNLARVNVELWNELDFLVRQGIGRSLAFYCGATRGTGLNWVEFRDASSGRRIAKYSESQGLKIYSL